MATSSPVNGSPYWIIRNGSGRSLVGEIPSNPPAGNYSFYPTGLQIFFRLATYSKGKLDLVNCFNSDGQYIVVTYLNDKYYFLSLSPGSFEGNPVFNLIELKSSETLTYWNLKNPRLYDFNVFDIQKYGDPRLFSVTLGFVQGNPNGGEMRFPCRERSKPLPEPVVIVCPCGSGFECDENGDCFRGECEGQPCGGACKGPCPSGNCVQDTSGQYHCVEDCTGRTCGGACHGDCPGYPAGTTCIQDPETFNYVCRDPCETGICGGKCSGTCPAGSKCVADSLGNYSCEAICDGPCGGVCQGTCPSGQTCLEGNDGKWSCHQDVPEDAETPITSQWWFWLLIVLGILLVLGLIVFFYLKSKKSKAKPAPKAATTPSTGPVTTSSNVQSSVETSKEMKI